MKKIVSLTLLLAFLNANLAWSVGKIQNEDVKSVTDLTNAGSDQSHLINTDKVYDILNAQQLSASISSGALGGSGGGAAIELLSNSGFEGGTTGWTASGGTFTTVNAGSNLIAGNKSADWVASASSQTLSSSALVIKGLAGGQCSASMYYIYGGTAADYTFRVIDGGSNILASTSLGVQALANTPTILTFPCGGTVTSTLKWQLISNVSSPGHIYVDTTHLGSLTVQQSSQAQLWGGVVVTGCASAWTGVGTSFGAYTAQTGCTYTAFGNAQAPATQIPGVKFATLPAGEYLVQYEGTWASNVANKTSYVQFSDGTNTSREISELNATAAGALYGNGFLQSLTETAAQTNVTIQVFGKQDSGGSNLLYGTAGSPGVIKVYYFPSTTTGTVNVGQQPQSWSGYQTVTSGCTTTSSSFGDLSGCTGTALTTGPNNNLGTVTTAASSLPGFTFTPTTAQTDFVCATVFFRDSLASDPAFRIVDGSGTLIANQNGGSSVANTQNTTTLCGLYNAPNTSATTIKIQAATDAGTLTLMPAQVSGSATISWTIINLSAALGAAQFNGPGSVTSGGTTAFRAESASIAGTGSTAWQTATACNSGTCATFNASTSGWISFAYDGSTGNYTGTITSGIFSGIPNCTCSWDGAGADNYCEMDSAGRTLTSTFVHVHGAANGGFTIMCMGPH